MNTNFCCAIALGGMGVLLFGCSAFQPRHDRALETYSQVVKIYHSENDRFPRSFKEINECASKKSLAIDYSAFKQLIYQSYGRGVLLQYTSRDGVAGGGLYLGPL